MKEKQLLQMFISCDKDKKICVRVGKIKAGVVCDFSSMLAFENVFSDKDLLVKILQNKIDLKLSKKIDNYKILKNINILNFLKNKNIISVLVCKQSLLLTSFSSFNQNGLKIEIKGDNFAENLANAFEIAANRISHINQMEQN